MSHLEMNKGKIIGPILENRAFLAVAQCQILFLLFQSLSHFFESFSFRNRLASDDSAKYSNVQGVTKKLKKNRDISDPT